MRWVLVAVLACAQSVVLWVAAPAARADWLRVPIGTSSYQCQIDQKALFKTARTGRQSSVTLRPALKALAHERTALRARIKQERGPARRRLLLRDRITANSAIRQGLRRCATGRLDDLGRLGLPEQKRAWSPTAFPVQGPDGVPAEQLFAYDTTNYFVHSQAVHGTLVTVAIHNDAIAFAEARHAPREFAESVIGEFHAAWHVFDGFPLDGYLFKVRSPAEQLGLVLSQGGVALDAHAYSHRDQGHEIFHAWNGKTFTYVPDGTGDLFQLETWVTEGATVYFSSHQDNAGVGFQYYPEQQRGEWHHDAYANAIYGQYLERVGSAYDLSYRELAARGGTEASEYQTMLAARGHTLSYIADLMLTRRGSGLDELLRHLYQSFGLSSTPYTQADVDAFLQRKLGEQGAATFDRLLRTGALLRPAVGGSQMPFIYR